MKNANKNYDQGGVCNCLNLRRAAQSITKVYDRFLESSGLKISQYSLIRNIGRLEPVNVSDLALELKLDRTTLVRNLKPIEEKGLIADLSFKGARDRQLVLTDAGKNALSAATLLWQKAQQYIENTIGREDIQTLSTLLLKIEHLTD
jgi:DNA-binding MarR family transcriptional regulator